MKKNLTKVHLIGYALLLIIISFSVLSITYSRYLSKINGNVVASVAVWNSDVSGDLIVDTSGLSPGKSKNYTFKITNTKEGKISEISQEYKIRLETTKNLPLIFTLTGTNEKNNGQLITKQDGILIVDENGKATSGAGILPHSAEAVHSYTLDVTWDSNQPQSEYADEIDMITLTVEAKQVDPNSK